MPLPFRAAAYLVATLSGASLGYSISGGVGEGAVPQNTMPVTPVATPETMSDGPPPAGANDGSPSRGHSRHQWVDFAIRSVGFR